MYERYIQTFNEGFTHDGVNIAFPHYDITMRFEVDPHEYYGDDYEEFLHELCRSFMDDIIEREGGDLEPMSLDEFYYKYGDDFFTPMDEKIVKELLASF